MHTSGLCGLPHGSYVKQTVRNFQTTAVQIDQPLLLVQIRRNRECGVEAVRREKTCSRSPMLF